MEYVRLLVFLVTWIVIVSSRNIDQPESDTKGLQEDNTTSDGNSTSFGDSRNESSNVTSKPLESPTEKKDLSVNKTSMTLSTRSLKRPVNVGKYNNKIQKKKKENKNLQNINKVVKKAPLTNTSAQNKQPLNNSSNENKTKKKSNGLSEFKSRSLNDDYKPSSKKTNNLTNKRSYKKLKVNKREGTNKSDKKRKPSRRIIEKKKPRAVTTSAKNNNKNKEDKPNRKTIDKRKTNNKTPTVKNNNKNNNNKEYKKTRIDQTPSNFNRPTWDVETMKNLLQNVEPKRLRKETYTTWDDLSNYPTKESPIDKYGYHIRHHQNQNNGIQYRPPVNYLLGRQDDFGRIEEPQEFSRWNGNNIRRFPTYKPHIYGSIGSPAGLLFWNQEENKYKYYGGWNGRHIPPFAPSTDYGIETYSYYK